MVMYNIACDCGQLSATINGAVQTAGFCHCASCRRVTGSVMIGFVALMEDALQNIQGEVSQWPLPDKSMVRYFCPTCGRMLWNTNKFPGFIVIGVETLRKDGLVDEAAEPKLHLNYAERVIDAADDLPKFLNFPEAFGGDGILFEEKQSEEAIVETEQKLPAAKTSREGH